MTVPPTARFYGVLLWADFEAAKHVRQALGRLRRGLAGRAAGGGETTEAGGDAAAAGGAGGMGVGAAGAAAVGGCGLRLVANANPLRTWERLEAYHSAQVRRQPPARLSILLHPHSPFSRRFNRDAEGVSAE